MRVTCYDHYLHAYISTVGKKKTGGGYVSRYAAAPRTRPVWCAVFSQSVQDRQTQTNMESWQAAVFWRLLIHRRAVHGTLAQSLGRMLAVADRAALLNAPDSASRRLLLINPSHPKVSPLTEWSCRLQVQARVPSRRKCVLRLCVLYMGQDRM